MKYALVFAAAISGAFAATSKPFVPGYGDETPSSTAPVATTAAPATTPAPEGAETSTVFQTEVDTVFSCGPEVTSCPYRSTTPVQTTPVPTTSAEKTTPVISTSQPPVTTSAVPPPPPPPVTKVSTEVVSTTPAASSSKPPVTTSAAPPPPPVTKVSTEVVSTTPAASSSQPPVTTSAPPPPPPPVTLVSTSVEIEQCTPSTITHYITVVSQPAESKMTPVVQTTPEAISKPFSSAAPYGTAPAGSVYQPSGSVVMKPTPSSVNPPIQTGAAVANSVQLSGVAVAFAAYLLF